MFGIWQVQERNWLSWDAKAAWLTRDLAEKNKAEAQRAYPNIVFEVRPWHT